MRKWILRCVDQPPSTAKTMTAGLRLLMLALFSLLLISPYFPNPGLAQPRPNTPPPDFPPRVYEIARELRCPACQGESTAESNAGVAVEMRRIIAEQLAQGKTEAEIRQFFVDRYGYWVLYEPPFRGYTLLVWLSPLIGMALVGFGLWRYQAAARARARTGVAGVSDEEIARLESELNLNPEQRKP